MRARSIPFDEMRVTAVPTAAEVFNVRRVADVKDTLPAPLPLDEPPAPVPLAFPGLAPPIIPAPPPALVPGQVVLKTDDLCGICDHLLVWPRLGDQEGLVGLCCTDPVSHVFHESCLKEWRASTVKDLAVLCPQCNVNPMHAITRRVASRAMKTQIKKKRESCWRHFWTEWTRQQTAILVIMMAVGMGLVMLKVLQEWVRTWSDRTEL